MNRRELGGALLRGAFATAGAGLPAAAWAQGAMGEAERQHAMETLRNGGLALMTSQMALEKGRNAAVKEFAGFEVTEQTTIAQIIRESKNMTPPPPGAMEQEVLARLNVASGRAFDRAYVAAQIEGHQKLLQIQETYLANGQDMPTRHVAMLARGQIMEHLALLGKMRRV
ncbi:DUF4142 domain-containing protein [Croceibacterium mercuriale]|uniref:DUF4142 domain-containing protein n=1 Tax=Croceibacterium mercuriale TaxID=1572751 RepID=UPI0009DF2B28|nr:DUF4142 domain-containing protein [Croceibacterium mercuriale]